MRTLQL